MLCATTLSAQTSTDEYNEVDQNGKKQGPWRKYYSGDSLVKYEGQFKNDKPVGIFTYYYTNGDRRVLIQHVDDHVARAVNFYPGGALMAKGIYYDREKDSTWIYYDQYGSIMSEEHYIQGKRYGNWKIYYPNGIITEEKYYENSQENGPYIRRYESGKVLMEATYVDGVLEGEATYYHENGNIETEGRYHRDAREGTWKRYDESGELIDETVYVKGVPYDKAGNVVNLDSTKFIKKDRFTIDDVVEEDYSKIPTKEEEKNAKKDRK